MKLRLPYTDGPTYVPRGLRVVLDPMIVLPALTIFAMSLAALFTVVYHPMAFEINPALARDFSTPFVKHLIWGLLGISGMIFFAYREPDRFGAKAVWIYLGGFVLLVAVLLIGVKVRDIRAWISLGFLTFQPSELVKIALVIALAKFLSHPLRVETPLLTLLASSVLVGIPALLVLKQPDMGTVIVYVSLLLTVPFAAGLPSRYLVLIVISSMIAGLRLLLGLASENLHILPAGGVNDFLTNPNPSFYIFGILAAAGTVIALAMKLLRMRHVFIVWLFFVIPAAAYSASFPVMDHLKEHQRLRLLTFIAPQLDPKGSGYNIIQSQIAFGSGGLLGQGFDGATQSTLGFLPERQTDFIFSVIGEVFGFAGVSIVVLSFLILILRILWIGYQSRTKFGMLVTVGTATIMMTHVAVNMGMAIGVMPIMGIPLPLASYGGTAMVTCFTLLGLILSIGRDSKLQISKTL